MKIIKGSDYYDGAGYGIDPDIVFVREPVTYVRGDTKGKDHPFPLPSTIESNLLSERLSFFRVIIAGQVFPGLHVYRPRQRTGGLDFYGNARETPEVAHLAYDLDTALEYLRKSTKSGYLRPSLTRLKERVERHFEKTEDPVWTDWLINHGVVTATVSRPDPHPRASQTVLAANTDTLKDFEAYRLMDPFTAHMEISRFVSGVLPGRESMVELSDTDRIRKAGFDLRTSFRKPKSA